MRSSTSSSDGGGRPLRSRKALVTSAGVLAAALAYAEVAPVTAPPLTGNNHSMAQYESFRAHVRRDGPHDFIVFGNSTAREGVDTRLLAARLEERIGRPVVGYNFAWGGLGAPGFPFQVRLAYGVDQPPLCIFVVTPEMMGVWASVDGVRQQRLDESPYGLALRDSLRWRGALNRALLDHVRLFRIRYALKDLLLGEPPVDRRIGTYNDASGFLAMQKGPPENLKWDWVKKRHRDWCITSERKEALASAARVAREHGARVFLVEAARHPDEAAHAEGLEEQIREYRVALSEIAASVGAEVIPLDDDLRLGELDFLDTHHLNAQGAERYTRWLADRLPADALPSRDGRNPAGP